MRRGPRLVRAVYRAILRLYPHRVRARLADDQLRLFEELWIHERPARPVAAWWWTTRALLRAVLTGFALHRDERTRLQPTGRDRPRRPLMDLILLDFRQAWRAATRRRAATLGLVAVIGLGVGLTSAMFALADPYVLRPLPYADPDRLVMINGSGGAVSRLTRGTAIPTLEQWQTRTDLFSGLTAWKVDTNVRVRTAEGAELLKVGGVSTNALDVLGVRAPDLEPLIAAGRRHDVALAVTARGRRLLGDAGERGRVLDQPGGRRLPVVAAVPSRLLFPGDPRFASDLDAWTTFDAGPIIDVREWQPSGQPAVSVSLRMVGRLAPGVTADVVRAALAFPREDGEPVAVDVRPLSEVLIGDARRSLALGALAAALGVLLACAGHAANLLLAGALYRTRERATRAALGASRFALARLTLVETVLTGAAACVAGLVVCTITLAILSTVIPLEYATLGAPSLSWRAIAFAVVATVVTIVVASVPAAMVRRFRSRLPLREGDGSARGVRVVRFAITAAQSALVVVLAIGAAMLLRSQGALLSQATGYDYFAAAVSVRYPDQLTGEALQAEVDKSVVALRRRFGDGVAVVHGSMLNDSRSGTIVGVDGKGGPVDIKAVTPEFFKVAGLTVLQGRALQPSDTRRAGVVVNEAFVRRYWPDQPAIGRAIQFGRTPASVVGVVEDSFDVALDVPPTPTVFSLFESPASPFAISFVLRLSGHSYGFESDVTHALATANRDVVVRDVSRIGERLLLSVRDRIFATLIVLFFALAAIGVSIAGVIGIITFIVGRRTREIAIRLAIGARASQVRRLVLVETLVAVTTGAAAGLIAGQWMSKSLGSLLYGVEPGDWTTALIATFVTLLVVTSAANVPASRAAKLPPSIALRVE